MSPGERVDFWDLSKLRSSKPLIHDYFSEAHDVAMRKLLKNLTRSRSLHDGSVSSPGLSQTSVFYEHQNTDVDNGAAIPVSDERLHPQLFVLSPSVTEPQRYSGGELLSETESLQAKHASEYNFLIPAINFAINSVINAHEIWRQEMNLPQTRRQTTTEAESRSLVFHVVGTSTYRDVKRRESNQENSQKCFDRFETSRVPDFSLCSHLRHLVDHTYVSPSVLLIACLYIDRLLTRNTSLLLSFRNIFKLLTTSTRVASKVMDTRTLSNKNFAKVCGVTNTELNILEAHFMRCIELDLHVEAAEFYRYAEGLITPPSVKILVSSSTSLPMAAEMGACVSGKEEMLKWSLPVVQPVHSRCGSSSSVSDDGVNDNDKTKERCGLLPPVVSQRLNVVTPCSSQARSPSRSITARNENNTFSSAVSVGLGGFVFGSDKGSGGMALTFLRQTTNGLPALAPSSVYRKGRSRD